MWCIRKECTVVFRFAVLLTIVFVNATSFAQFTFSKRYPIGSNSGFLSIMVKPTGYFMGGTAVTSSESIFTELLFAQISYQGDLQLSQSHGNTLDQFLFGRASMIAIAPDTCLSFVNRSKPGGMLASLIWVNYEGDTLKSVDFSSPYMTLDPPGNNFIVTRDVEKDNLGNYYLTCGISKPGTANDVVVMKSSPTGVKLWEYIYATPADPDACYSLVAQADGVVLGVYSSAPTWEETEKRLIKLNGLTGLEVSNVVLPALPLGNYGLFRDMIQIENGNFIVTSSFQSYQILDGVSPIIYEVTPAGEILWHYVPVFEQADNQHMDHLTRTADGNYVGGALHLVDIENENDREEAWLIKVNTQGQLMWDRKYYFEEGNCKINRMYDLQATPDGGVVFCGESRDCDEPNGPNQQAWLVKLDEHGCLVPGCHVGVEESENENRVRILVGPNPVVGEEVFVFVGVNSPSTGSGAGAQGVTSLRVYDMQGREMKRLPLRGEGTYAVSCSGWASGVYLFSLVDEGGRVLQTLKVVRE